MGSVLTPYKSSDGNNPYTAEQLKVLWGDLQPSSREPGRYNPSERILLQKIFLSFIELGYTPTRACNKIKELSLKSPQTMPYADYSVFMAWKAYDAAFSEAYEVAYAMGTDNLEDKGVELAYGGNASMLQYLLNMRNQARYKPRIENQLGSLNNPVSHVHTIRLVAAQPKVLEIEGEVTENFTPMNNFEKARIEDAEVSDE